VKIPGWWFVKIDKQVPDLRELTGDKVKTAIDDLTKATAEAGDGKSADKLKSLGAQFEKYGFEAVEKIAKGGAFSKGDGKVGQDMSVMRRQMINHAMAQASRKLILMANSLSACSTRATKTAASLRTWTRRCLSYPRTWPTKWA